MKLLYQGCMVSFRQILSTFSDNHNVRGDQFETLCKWILETDPIYTNKLKKVWMWDDWPGRWGPDSEIDLIAEDKEGKIWAIQAKCYDEKYQVTKKDMDSFILRDCFQKKNFSQQGPMVKDENFHIYSGELSKY